MYQNVILYCAMSINVSLLVVILKLEALENNKICVGFLPIVFLRIIAHISS